MAGGSESEVAPLDDVGGGEEPVGFEGGAVVPFDTVGCVGEGVVGELPGAPGPGWPLDGASEVTPGEPSGGAEELV